MADPELDAALKLKGRKGRYSLGTYELTAEEAKAYGWTIEPGDKLRITPPPSPGGIVAEGARQLVSLISPTGWLYEDMEFGDEGKVLDYTAISPTGQRIPKARTAALLPPEPPPEMEPVAGPMRGVGMTQFQGEMPAEFSAADLKTLFPERFVSPQTLEKQIETIRGMKRLRGEDEEGEGFEQAFGIPTPQSVLDSLRKQATALPETFLRQVVAKGRTPEAERLLNMFFRVEPGSIDRLFRDVKQEAVAYGDLPQLLQESLPFIATEKNVYDLIDYFQQRPEELRTNLVGVGRTPTTEALVRAAFPQITDEGVDMYFQPETSFKVTDTGIEMKPGERAPSVAPPDTGWGSYQYWLKQFAPPEGELSTGKVGERSWRQAELNAKAAASLVAGVGHVVTTTAGAARWLGFAGVGESLSETGQALERKAPPPMPGEFDFGDLMNPEFYATKVVSMVPFTLSLLPLAFGGAAGGGAVAAAFGVGRIGTMIIGGLAGAALSRPLESAMEAGGTYDDAIARGKTEAEAKKEADEVFRNNMWMGGADAFEIAIALAPTPKGVPKSLVKAGLVRLARIGGKMVIVGLSEGGEEVYQDMVQRHARGEEWKLDPVSKEVFALGAVMGVGMGLGGDVLSGVVDKAKGSMSGSLRTKFDWAVANALNEGLRQNQADLRGLESVAAIPEGQSVLLKAIADVKAALADQTGAFVPEAEPGKPKLTDAEILEQAAKEAAPPVTKGAEAIDLKQFLPEGWRTEVGKTRVKEGIPFEAEVNEQAKKIVFSSSKTMADRGIVNHEVAHVLVNELPTATRTRLFEDYRKALGLVKDKKWLEEQEIAWRVASEEEWRTGKGYHPSENLSIDLGEYATNPASMPSEVADVFKKYFNLAKAKVSKEAIPPTGEAVAGKGIEITKNIRGEITNVEVRLPGRPAVEVARADENLTREQLIEKARAYWQGEDNTRLAAESLKKKYPDAQVSVESLPQRDIRSDLPPGRYVVALKAKRRQGQYDVLEAVRQGDVLPGKADYPDLAAKATTATVEPPAPKVEQQIEKALAFRASKATREQLDEAAADLTRLRMNAARLKGSKASTETELRNYFADIEGFFEKWLPEKRGQTIAARMALEQGQMSDFIIEAESLLGQGHLLVDALERLDQLERVGVKTVAPAAPAAVAKFTPAMKKAVDDIRLEANITGSDVYFREALLKVWDETNVAHLTYGWRPWLDESTDPIIQKYVALAKKATTGDDVALLYNEALTIEYLRNRKLFDGTILRKIAENAKRGLPLRTPSPVEATTAPVEAPAAPGKKYVMDIVQSVRGVSDKTTTFKVRVTPVGDYVVGLQPSQYRPDERMYAIYDKTGKLVKGGFDKHSEAVAAARKLVAPAPKAEAPTPAAPAVEGAAEAVVPEKAEAPAAEAPTPKPELVEDMKRLALSIETEVKAMSTAVKGLKGDAAKVARETLAGLKRELQFAQKTLDSFEKRPGLPEATRLRQTIMAWARLKGIPRTQLQKIMSEVAGRRHLGVIPQEQLMSILDKVKEARPVTLRGERVITPKTEKKIQTLKESLISSRQMTDKIYNRLLERLNLRTDKYESASKYVTESRAKELIRAMNDEAILAKWDVQVEDALAKNPTIKEARDILHDRGMTGSGVEFDGKPIEVKRRTELWSMRYYMLNLQKKLNAPVYDVWQKINQGHLVARDRHNQQLARLERSTPNFKEVVTDEAALKRIEDYIAAKHKLAEIKAPELSADEMAIATELERGYFQAQNDVRFIRFTNAYAENEGSIDLIAREIPNAPRAALRRAIDIYEGKGAKALREFTDTQKWGVIEKGYDPRSFIKPTLYFFKPKATTFAKGLLRTRNGIEHYAEDRNIIQRYSRHQRQLIALEELSGLIRAFGRVYAENAGNLDAQSQRNVSGVLSRGLNEMKGFREDAGAIVHAVERLYGQVASAVFWRPDLVLRNKFQNFAFNPDYWAGRFLNPETRPGKLSESRRRFFEVFVSQERVFQFEYLLYGEKPLPGFDRLTRLARRTSLYPWSDKSNRAEAFSVRINRVDKALKAYEKHGDTQKLLKESGLNEFEPRQQAEALELLAMEKVDYGIDGMPVVSGKEAFALYNAQQLVNNVHFLYDRAQRAPAEMGATGRTLGNILVFNRSWGERFILQGRKLAPTSKATQAEKIRAMTVIVGVIVAGLLAGEAYKKLTDKRHNPYNPLNIITWSPGGLALGVTEDISSTIYLMTQAVQGDKSALGSLPGVLAGVATLTLPFYKNVVQALDAVTDMKNIDVYALRKIRELLDDEYEIRGGVHEVDRALLEALQKAFLGKYDAPQTPQEKTAEAESLLGTTIEEEDRPFNLEEPRIYGMAKLNGRFSQVLANVKPEDITKEKGYSELAVAWKEKEVVKSIFDSLPDKKIYEITKLSEEQAEWASRNKRLLRLVEEYHGLAKSEQKGFLEQHTELTVNPRTEWLKVFPKANAQLAIWGYAKILTQEAYDEAQKLIKQLDIPEDAYSDLIPPKDAAKSHFEYEDAVAEFGGTSVQARLIRAKDDKFNAWLGLEPIDEDVKGLELKVKTYDKTKEYESFSDKDSPNYIPNEDDRKKKQDAFNADPENKEWLEDKDRIAAYSKGTKDKPTDDTMVNKWVERGNVSRESPGYDAEEKLWYVDNPDAHQWALDNDLSKDDGTKWNVPSLRITAKYRKEDAEYQAILDKYPGRPAEEIKEAKDYMAKNEAYRKDQRRKKIFDVGGDDWLAEQNVSYGEIADQFGSGSAEAKLFRLEDAPDLNTFGMNDKTLKWQPILDDVRVLRINRQWRKETGEYQAILDKYPGRPDEEIAEARSYLADNEPFRKDRRRKEAYGLTNKATGEKFPDAEVEKFVDYYEKPIKGKRRDRFLVENGGQDPKNPTGFAKAMLDSGRLKLLPDPKKVPAVQWDDLYDTHKSLFDRYDAATTDADRARVFAEVPTFRAVWYRRKGYGLFFPEPFVENYVTYNLMPKAGYEQKRYLSENRRFYGLMQSLTGLDDIDFSKVPSRSVEAKYNQYLNRPVGNARTNFRFENPDLDAWLLLTGKVSKRADKAVKLSQWDEMFLRLAEQSQALAQKMRS